MFDTIIQGGTLVTSDETFDADLGFRDGRIAAIGKDLAAQGGANAKTVDARGRYVIPGGVDAHVHLDLHVGDITTSDDFDSGTRAAACGGVTTVIDFATPRENETLEQALDNWLAKARDKACVDYAFHVCLTNWRRQHADIPRLIERGVPTFKQFMIYKAQGWQSEDADLFAALEALRECDAMLLVHAESANVLDLLIERYHNPESMKRHGAILHTLSRPNFVETEAIERAIRWSRETGGRLYIVHMSTGEGADLVRRAREEGVRVLAETCAQYLVLDDAVFARDDGHLYATCPQLKKPADQQRLWRGLRDGEVCVVSTDTCTFTREQKARWGGDWTKIPMGMPGLETLLPLVYTHGVLGGRLSVNEFVAKCCANPARVMGLHPRKGALAVGADADVVIFHPNEKRTVDWQAMQTRCDWSPYQGWELAGFAEHTFCRGRQIVENYQFVGRNGYGEYIPRRNVGEVTN